MSRKLVRLLALFLVVGLSADRSLAQDTRDLSLDSLLVMQISTASKHWETASEAPASVTVITSDMIQKFGFRTLAEALASVRSFYVSYDRNYTYLGIRGFSRPTDYNDRILLLLNGHTINEGFSGTSPFGTDFALDLNSVDRIEVVRGPGSALYGSGALFAVVNVITRSVRSFDQTQVGLDAGSFGAVKGSLLAGKEFDNGLGALFSAQWSHMGGQDLYFREFDSPLTDNGIARGLDWDHSYGLFSSLSFKGWSAQGLMSWREKGVPTASFGTAFDDSRSRTLDRYGFADVAFQDEIALDKHILVRGYYDEYYYTGSYPYDILQQDETTARRLGGECQLRWDMSLSNRVTCGLEYASVPRADYHNWDATTTYFDANIPYSLFSLYLQEEFQVTPSLSLNAGVRRDAYSSRGNTYSPRGGIVFHPGQETTLKLLFGQAFRSPNPYESNYEDLLSGFKSNHALSPERIQTAEFVMEQRVAEEYFATVSFYHNWIDGLIDQVIDPVDSLLQFRNISRARAIGGECELTARLQGGLTGYLSYSHQVTTDAGTGSTFTNSPSDVVKAGLSWAPLSFLQTAMDAVYETGRRTIQETETGPVLVANLRLGIRFPGGRGAATPRWMEKFQLSVLIRNLFNASYATPGGFEHVQASIPQDRRNFLVSLICTL